jgi:hypothetical protein
MTHTPGPWILEDSDTHNKVFVSSKDKMTRIVSFGPRENWDKVDEANASLVAAAPELLEALQAIADLNCHVSIQNGIVTFEDGGALDLNPLIRNARPSTQ